MDDSRTTLLANILHCQKGSFPFTYLGLPLGISRPKPEHYIPLLQRIDRSLTGCSTMLSYDGRMILIKSVFSALPTYYMCTLALPSSIIS